MLLQRLVRDDKCGLNYDYMGRAEYEFGATRNGRAALAKAFIAGTLHARVIQFTEVHHGSSSAPITVIAMGSKELIDNIVAAGGKISVTKEAFRTNDDEIIGWMNVAWESYRATPLLMVRHALGGAEIEKAVRLYLEPFIEQVKASMEESG